MFIFSSKRIYPQIVKKIAFLVIALQASINAQPASVTDISVEGGESQIKGTNVRIICSVTSFNSGVVKVFKTDSDTTPGTGTELNSCYKAKCDESTIGRYDFSVDLYNIYITIDNLTRSEDQKWWHCISSDSESRVAHIIVKTLPTTLILTHVPSGSQDLSNTDVTLTCQTNCLYPNADIRWFYTDANNIRQLYNLTSSVQGSSTPECSDPEIRISSTMTLFQYTTLTNNADLTTKFECGVTTFAAPGYTPIYSTKSSDITFSVKAENPSIKNKTFTGLLSGDPVPCVCETTATRPAASVTWKLGTRSLTNISNTERTTSTGLKIVTSTVTFTPSKADNKKEVVCETSIPRQTEKPSDRTQITVWWSPITPSVSAVSTFPWLVGETNNVLKCTTTDLGNPTATVEWTQQSGYVNSNDELVYSTLSPANNNEAVKCRLINEYTERKSVTVESQTTNLNVEYKPVITVKVDNIETTNTTITEGQPFIAVCSAIGNPDPTVTWSGRSSNILNFTDINRTDDSTYTCIAQGRSTVHGNLNSQRTLNIEVLYAPDVTMTITDVGSTVTITCEPSGKPQRYTYVAFEQTWNGGTIPNPNKPAIGGIQNIPLSMEITEASLEDSGLYTCVVNNGIEDRSGQGDQRASKSYLVKEYVTGWTRSKGIECDAETDLHDATAEQCSDASKRYEEIPPQIYADDTYAGAPDNSTTIPILVYSHPPFKDYSIKRGDGLDYTSNNRVSIEVNDADVMTEFYGTEVILNGSRLDIVISNLTEADFSNFTVMINNDVESSSWNFTLSSQSTPRIPTMFVYIDNTNPPLFYWEGGFNGGYPQTFILETSREGTDMWMKKLEVTAESTDFRLPNGSFMANVTDLSPGTYKARLYAENQLGRSTIFELDATFFIPEVHDDPDSQNQIPIAAIAGCAAAVVVIAIVVVVIVFVKRRRHKANDNQELQDGYDNDEFVPEEVENALYVSAGPNPASTQHSPVPDNTYAQVNKIKPAKDGDSYVYAEVKKDKQVENGTSKGKNAKSVSKVNKKSKQGKNKTQKGDVYENSPMDVYENSQKVKGVEAIYEETEVGATYKPQKQVNQDGLTYVVLDFKKTTKSNSETKIIGSENMTEYVSIDFNKRADPLPDSDEEDK